MLSILQLRLVLLLEILRTFGLRGVKLAEVSFVVVQPLTVLMDNVLSDIVQEGSVVGSTCFLGKNLYFRVMQGYLHDEQGSRPSLQIIFQPGNSV